MSQVPSETAGSAYSDNGNEYSNSKSSNSHIEDGVDALVKHKCTPSAMASAFKYLCDRLGGLEVLTVSGEVGKD